MSPSENALALARHFEGLSLEPYKDPAGLLTVGYGHRITSASDPWCAGVTAEQAETLLQADMAIAGDHVADLVQSHLEQYQFDALCDFTFNLGRGRLQTSTLLKELNAGIYASVPKELLRWVYAAGTVLEGLQLRRAAEAAVWRGLSAAEAIAEAEDEWLRVKAR